MAKNYLNNKDILHELELYHQTDVISQRLHKMIYLLCERIARQSIYYRYLSEKTTRSIDMSDSYIELIHEGYVNCLTKLKKFSMYKTNPFAYFTSVINNAFKDYFMKENKFERIKQISQKDYENRFLLRYGFYPSNICYDEMEN